MPEYKNGKVYKIISENTDMVYIGSTSCYYLSERMRLHRHKYREWKDGNYHFMTSFKVIECGDPKIVLLEKYPCKSKDELEARERYWIENTENVANKNIPTRTLKEYLKDNEEKIRLRRQKYDEKNKESMKIKKHAYYQKNKQHLQEKGKKYREENKETRERYRALEITCDCGSKIKKAELSRHRRSKKHKEWVEKSESSSDSE